MNGASLTDADDVLAVEDPLEIRIEYGRTGARTTRSISVTMRTPGHDAELAAGFLFTEGIISSAGEITAITPNSKNENILVVSLAEAVAPNIKSLERNFYTTSSCGVCGKASIEAVRTSCPFPDVPDAVQVHARVIYRLPTVLRGQQDIFSQTGGLHGCALFDTAGKLLLAREDVGRHNALDKLIGAALQQQILPVDSNILVLSGRASFELVQKAIMAGIKVIAAVGAPSSLAVDMAEEWGITLIGFLRGERFNIYSGAERVVI